MAWIGWGVAILAMGAAAWLWRQLARERAHAEELLYAKLDLENEMDALRADSAQGVEAAVAAAGVGVGEVARHLHDPLESICRNLESTQADLVDYRGRVKRFDEAVQYCLQPVELILGADKASLVQLVSHVEGARRKLFEARTAVEKNPLHKQANALTTSLDQLQTLSAYTHGLLAAQAAHGLPAPEGSAAAPVPAKAR
jgi:two-component system NtrC family sensor kinase